MVDVTDIMRLVGPSSFQRGLGYARGGAVIDLAWDGPQQELRGTVLGSRPEAYHPTATLAGGKPVSSSCDCPVGFDCKHVAATLLQSNTVLVQQLERASSIQRARPKAADWKTAVAALTVSPTNPGVRSTSMGLLFELREQIPRSRGRWNGPSAKPATAATTAAVRLGVRPVTLSDTGNWTRGSVTWNSLSYQVNRLGLREEQHRWFSQFSALHRATRDTFSGQEPDWLYLEDFHSPLFWQLLEDAEARGIALVTGKKATSVTVGEHARVSIDASLATDLTLSPVVEIDGRTHPVSSVGTVGDHGVYAFAFDPRLSLTLARTSAPLTEKQRSLLGDAQFGSGSDSDSNRDSAVVIPAHDVEEFLSDYYPRLRRSIDVTSTDDSLSLPPVPPPVLVATVTFLPKQRLTIGWAWKYGTERKSVRGNTDRNGDDRDVATEREILDRVERMLGPVSGSTLDGLDAADFADRTLPELQAVDGVVIETVGDRPDYTELTGAPKLTFTTMPTDKRDWFDLGVYVAIDGRNVPFTTIIKALSKGAKKLLLIDDSYLSLEQPVFEQLKALIDEASALPEWETGLRISRYQASLWADFEDLADETVEATEWRDTARGLLAIDTVEATEPPAALLATLRPYQRDGFDWLALLWKHRLGGVLADDMGLGKTLQALALMAHATEGMAPAERAPFLVVAPTSVVPNWVTEAGRFTPAATVRSVATTRQSIEAVVTGVNGADGADIVVTSYALFRLDFESYQSIDWAGLILDEAQFVKNPASKAHEAAVALRTPFKLAITGTPMENSLMDLWSLFSIVAPGLFPSARRFTEEYVRPVAAGAGQELIAKLRRRIRPLMMRRTKELVATELPEKQEQVLRIDLAPRHRTLYDTFLQKERQKLLGLIEDLDRNRFIVFRSLTLLRLLSLDASLVDESYSDIPSAKLDALFEQLEDVVAEGHRALVFSQFTSFLRKAAARMDAAGIAYEYLDGSTLSRAEVIARFKDGDAPAFLISLKAGGFGLNLTEADYVFLLDPWWNPATETQAVDRTHRIGQTRSVNVYRLVASGTIEEKVMALRDRKAELFDAVLDDDAAFSSSLTVEDIRGLLEG
ncbi:MAG: hypothetical protein JWM49_930 [Microbacteriaceae bacterium]|nr:hypothetical protein [Microbacteriaceae bacterium]